MWWAIFEGFSTLDVVLSIFLVYLAITWVPKKLGLVKDQSIEKQQEHKDDKKRDAAANSSSSPPIKQRYFTKQELLTYNGTDDTPIYIALKGIVFDVSSKDEFYGPGGGYHLFAGHDATRALAKMSFEPEELENSSYDDLNFMEKETLNDWMTKFRIMNAYPIVGRVLLQEEDLTLEQVSSYVGKDDKPIYIVVSHKIYDVTLTSGDKYGPDSEYHRMAGKDATRALATNCYEDDVLNNSSVSGNLTTEQQKVLQDWEEKFKSQYPVVGNLIS